jgi:hypothetical protein
MTHHSSVVGRPSDVSLHGSIRLNRHSEVVERHPNLTRQLELNRQLESLPSDTSGRVELIRHTSDLDRHELGLDVCHHERGVGLHHHEQDVDLRAHDRGIDVQDHELDVNHHDHASNINLNSESTNLLHHSDLAYLADDSSHHLDSRYSNADRTDLSRMSDIPQSSISHPRNHFTELTSSHLLNHLDTSAQQQGARMYSEHSELDDHLDLSANHFSRINQHELDDRYLTANQHYDIQREDSHSKQVVEPPRPDLLPIDPHFSMADPSYSSQSADLSSSDLGQISHMDRSSRLPHDLVIRSTDPTLHSYLRGASDVDEAPSGIDGSLDVQFRRDEIMLIERSTPSQLMSNVRFNENAHGRSYPYCILAQRQSNSLFGFLGYQRGFVGRNFLGVPPGTRGRIKEYPASEFQTHRLHTLLHSTFDTHRVSNFSSRYSDTPLVDYASTHTQHAHEHASPVKRNGAGDRWKDALHEFAARAHCFQHNDVHLRSQ